MILKAFRDKSNKDYVNKILDKRTNTVNTNKVKTIAILLNKEEFDDAEAFTDYFKELELTSPKSTVIYFSELEKEADTQWQNFFTKKDFGWSGKIMNQTLMQFINEPFDVLVGYYNKNVLEMNQITAMSKANLKVGVHSHDERLFDIILNLSVIRFDVFKKEFKKYLNILNKL
ncbi:MAG: hypothetical protein AAGI07_14910 [Bacteroidota bacterium]